MSKIKVNKKNKIVWIVIGIIVVVAIIAVGIIVGVKYSPSSSNKSIDYSYNADASYNLKIKTKNTAGTASAYSEILEKVSTDVNQDDLNISQEKIAAGIAYLCNNYDINMQANDAEKALYYSDYILTYIETNEENYIENAEIDKAYELASDAFAVVKFTYRGMFASVTYQNYFETAIQKMIG